MRQRPGRNNRITGASLIGHTLHSAAFFASTAMEALAALLGMPAALDTLAFTAKTPRMAGKGQAPASQPDSYSLK